MEVSIALSTEMCIFSRPILPVYSPLSSVYNLRSRALQGAAACRNRELCSVTRPLAEAAARDSGLTPIASGEVGAAGLLVALEIAGLALPVALLWFVSVRVNTKIALNVLTDLQ